MPRIIEEKKIQFVTKTKTKNKSFVSDVKDKHDAHRGGEGGEGG